MQSTLLSEASRLMSVHNSRWHLEAQEQLSRDSKHRRRRETHSSNKHLTLHSSHVTCHMSHVAHSSWSSSPRSRHRTRACLQVYSPAAGSESTPKAARIPPHPFGGLFVLLIELSGHHDKPLQRLHPSCSTQVKHSYALGPFSRPDYNLTGA